MAFFDDNNTLSSGSGKDPLDELNAELEQLKITLGELDTPSSSYPRAAEDKPPEPVSRAIPDYPIEDIPPRVERPAPNAAAEEHIPYTAPRNTRRSGPKTGIVVAAMIIGFIGIAVGLTVWLLNRPVDDLLPEEPTTATVTINDSLLGEVKVPAVEGASLNTYESENLAMGDDGFYAYYVDGKKVSEVGVDLSEYQGDIDFYAVKNAGVDFVMLRIGGRYYSDNGGMYSDSAFDTYYDQAKAAGLKVGAYFFSQAASVSDAREEAGYALDLLGGRELDYPIAFDWETIEDDTARTDDVTGELLTAIASGFCDRIIEGGYEPIVYASTSLMLQSYDFEIMKDYEFWLADYREFPAGDKMYYNFTMWQYTTAGTVDGIDGEVDLNLRIFL